MMGKSGVNDSISQSLAIADSAYSNGNPEKAVEIYSSIIKTEGRSAPLLFNLANAYYKSGHTAEAVVWLLRAHRLDPSNKEIKSNLNYLRSFVVDQNAAELKGKKGKVAADEPTFFGNLYSHIAEDHLSDTWFIWSVVCFLLFIICVSLYFFVKIVILRKCGFFGGFIFLSLSIIFVIFALMAASEVSREDKGVVNVTKVRLLTEAPKSNQDVSDDTPINSANASYTIHGGTEVTLLKETPVTIDNQKWIKVRLNSEIEGWLPTEDLEII